MKKIILSLGLAVTLLQSNAGIASNLWQEVITGQRGAIAQAQSDRYYQGNTQSLKQILSRAGQEGGAVLDTRIPLPLSNGEIKEFQLVETQVMSPGLAARYPEIKTYKISGIDGSLISGRLSLTPKGFSAMIVSPAETHYLDPSVDGLFRSYSKSSVKSAQTFKCEVEGHDSNHPVASSSILASKPALRVAGSMRLYRLALAATAEYVNMAGGSVQDALSEIVKTINRVNAIYQRDLGIQLVLVDNNDRIIFAGSTTSDPYPTANSGNLGALLTVNQTILNSRIGTSNYDIGHLFTSGFGGGIASVGSVCQDFKAQGATAVVASSSLGDPFDIDYVAHEIGHQFNAEHTFNGTTSSCSGSNRNAATAFEPGSGSSIMAYAGLCGVESLQMNSDAHFHAGTLAQINAFTTVGDGSSCGSLQSITNNPSQPSINPTGNFTIPGQTPFVLAADASDADADTLSYTWDEMDAGAATDSSLFGLDLGDNALFRSYLPQAQSWRYFPRLDSLLNQTTIIGEKLPTTSREVNFVVTVRDGKGGQAQDLVTINSVATTPFYVTSDTTSTSVSNPTVTRTLTWNVGGSNTAPINCSNVNIDLLKLNAAKTTYCEESLLTNTPNDGSQEIVLPDQTIPVARFKVSCSDNVFFALSRGDMAVTGSSIADVSCFSVVPDNQEQSTAQINVDPNTSFPSSSSEGDSGSFGLLSLFGLFSLLGLKRKLIHSTGTAGRN